MDYSPIILGAMRWGIWGANLSEKEVADFIGFSVSEGFTTFDHADIYGDYTTESLFGNAFSLLDIPRENVQLISKCGIVLPQKSNGRLKSYNYSKKYILQQVDKSLANLKTDYLDLFLLHRPSPLMDPEAIAAAFSLLRSAGKVVNFGVSNFSMAQFDLIADFWPALSTNQIELSVNQTQSFVDGTLDQMLRKKIKPMAWSVMGDYFQNPETPQNLRLKKIINELTAVYEAEENQILIAFLLKHPSRIIPVVGTSKKETIKKIKKSLTLNLTVEDWFRILEASNGKEVD